MLNLASASDLLATPINKNLQAIHNAVKQNDNSGNGMLTFTYILFPKTNIGDVLYKIILSSGNLVYPNQDSNSKVTEAISCHVSSLLICFIFYAFL